LFAFSHWIIGEDCYVFSNGVDSSLNITIAEQNTQANHVMTFLIEIGRPGIVRFNGSGNLSGNTNNQIARTGTSVGSYIGRRDDPGYFLDGDYYGNLYYAGIPNTAQLARIERYFAKLSGAVLVTPPNL
jgi:hypothetical protein